MKKSAQVLYRKFLSKYSTEETKCFVRLLRFTYEEDKVMFLVLDDSRKTIEADIYPMGIVKAFAKRERAIEYVVGYFYNREHEIVEGGIEQMMRDDEDDEIVEPATRPPALPSTNDMDVSMDNEFESALT